MEERIVRFIAALRTAGVRVSLAESADAFRAVQELGVRQRETFRASLQATLVKEAGDLPSFEELFPLFFDSAEAPPLLDLSPDLTPQEAQALSEALQQFKERLRQMLERLAQGRPLTREELEKLARQVGLNQNTELRYRNWMAQRMQRALGFEEARQALGELRQMLEQMGMDGPRAEQLRQLMQANQQALAEQIQQFAGQRIAENMSEQPPEPSADNLADRPFDSLSEHEMYLLRREVRRLANALRTRIALRQKRAHSGILDPKATIRANLKHAGVPIELRHRHKTLKPSLVVICDVSTSMRPISEFMLGLLYALQDQVSKCHAFAFIDHLEYISPDFAGQDAGAAVQQVLNRLPSGHYNTDLGRSLENFVHDHLESVNNRTTVIVVGDGRNNYYDPRLDLLSLLARRARRMIWFNPEGRTLWGSGDSDMLKYAPLCDAIFHVTNLSQLAAAVDQLLSN